MAIFLFLFVFHMFSIIALADETVSLIKVKANGMGVTEDAALKNAYSNAVEQAIGLFVDAETIVKNDAIIDDKILTHSRGYIEHVDILKKNIQDGIYSVSILAKVRKEPLVDVVKSNISYENKIDAQSLHAMAVSKQKESNDAKSLLKRAIKKFIDSKYYHVYVDGKLTLNKTSDGLIVPIAIEADLKKYNAAINPLIKIYDEIATSKENITKANTSFSKSDYYYRVNDATADCKRGAKDIIINTWHSSNYSQYKYIKYSVPEEVGKKLWEDMEKKARYNIEIGFFDTNDNLIATKTLRSKEHDFNADMFRISCCVFLRSYVGCPYFGTPQCPIKGPYHTDVEVKITPDEIQKIDHVKISFN